MPHKVFVTRRLPGDSLERLAASVDVDIWQDRFPPPPDVLHLRASDCDGLISTVSDSVDTSLLNAAPKLRAISNFAVGFDNIDVAECTARGIPVGNTPGVLTESTADQTFALILATSRRVVEAANAVLRGDWVTWEPDFMLGRDVHGATLGIVGKGAIGRAVARRATGFGMKVLFHSRAENTVPLDQLLAVSDIVSLHCPLTEETRGLIGETQLSLMKSTAILVNTARGPIVDQVALARALAAGEIAGAGLDVTAVEPISLDDPLLAMPNCIVLPHLGSATVATRSRMAEMAVDNIIAGLSGTAMPNCVNAESVKSGVTAVGAVEGNMP